MPKGNKGQQVILGSQVLLDLLEIWDPKDQKAFQATMVSQALRVRQGQLGLQDNREPEEQGVLLA